MSCERHVLGISGGKDSAALAIYMRDRVPEMEYYFCDTQKELPETYEYLTRMEAYLGKPIARLNSEMGFDHWLKIYGGYLPSTKMRWCTRKLKIEPFERWVGDDNVVSYVGIRADEDRDAYITRKPNIRAVYPFKEDGLVKDDVFRILEESGVGVPNYYEWRTRSGCYFCFFQRKAEWAGLAERHPELFELAAGYEKSADGSAASAFGFTWSQGESLQELNQPGRIEDIMRKHEVVLARERGSTKNLRLLEIIGSLEEALALDNDDEPCAACHI